MFETRNSLIYEEGANHSHESSVGNSRHEDNGACAGCFYNLSFRTGWRVRRASCFKGKGWIDFFQYPLVHILRVEACDILASKIEMVVELVLVTSFVDRENVISSI